MNAGRIEQYADPMTLYRKPASPFVLDFVGLSTRLADRVTPREGGEVRVATAYGELTAPGRFAVSDPVVIGVRP